MARTTTEIFAHMDERVGDVYARKQKADAILRFVLARQEAWRSLYPDQWVAATSDCVVAVESTPEALIEALRDGGFSVDDVQVRFVTPDKFLH